MPSPYAEPLQSVQWEIFTRAGAGRPMLSRSLASSSARFLAFCFSTRQRVARAVASLPSSRWRRCTANPPRLASIERPQDEVGGSVPGVLLGRRKLQTASLERRREWPHDA